MSVLFFTICALLALESPRIVAQAPPSPPRTTPSKDPRGDAAYVIEQQYNRVRFETNGAARRELNVRVKVIDEAALRAWGQLPLTYDSASEELTLARVDVQKPDGSIVSTAAGAIQDFAVRPFPQLPIFLDLHQKLVTISALRPGDVLVINAVWTSTHPIIPGQFSFQYTFNTHEVVRDERLEIDVPAAKPVIVRTLSGAPAEEHGGDGVMAADRRVYRWKTANTAPRKDEPNGDDDEEAPPADVRVTTFRTWDEVGRWFSELLPKTPDASVRAKAAELTKGLSDDKAKTEAIYAYVSTQIRYVSLSFGLGRYAPHAPAEVLANQYGDCKDKATLLAALLAAAGVESARVLVNSRRSASEDVPSPLEFDHMIAVVPRGPDAQWVWLDATTEVAPAGMLGGNVRARKGLFVGDARHPARLVTTPADPPFPSIDRIDVEGTVDALGVLHARVTQTMRGDSELAVRLILRTLPRDQWEDVAKGFAQAMQLEGDVTDIEAGDPADTRQPMQLSFALRRGGYLDWAAASSEVSPLMPTIPLPPLSEDDVKRRDHLTLRSPATVRAHVVIELPQGYAADPPVPVKIALAGLEYESAYRTEGARVIADREIRWNARRVAAADFGAYATFVRAVEADLKQHVKVRGTASGAIPAVPADATAGEVYHAAHSAFDAKQYETAVALWKRSAELDPKMGDAWISLGLAYAKLKKYDEAAAAIQKQIDLDPFTKRAYGDLGFVQKEAGRPELAVKAYAKQVELNPLDGAALKQLGEIYWDLQRYGDAAQTLEKASSIVKGDGWTFALLASAYLRLGEREKAMRAVDRAVEAEPTAAVIGKIAWELADRGVEPGRATLLGMQAIKASAEATRNLTFDSATSTHWDLTDRLAWSWDAIGWSRFQAGELDTAERYLRGAWKLAGHAAIADRLGQTEEKLQHRADALSLYLTSESLTRTPSKAAREGVARMTGPGADLTAMRQTARTAYARDRSVIIKGPWPEGSAEFELVVGTDRRATEARFAHGLDALRPLETPLRELTYPLEFPDPLPHRLLLAVRVSCQRDKGCAAAILPTAVAKKDR